MSELKAFVARKIDDGTCDPVPCIEVYPKSEADKVIAEKDKELRHQKYKRCLAMAKVCKLKRFDAADYRIPRRKWDFYDKWLKRWLELAEKFKEAK